MAVNERMVAGDGFMLNFLSVMQLLSAKVRVLQNLIELTEQIMDSWLISRPLIFFQA